MTNKIIILTVIFSVIVIYYLLKNKKNKQCKYGEKSCPLADSDWSRLKTIPPLNCIECGDCVVESNGCCANCNSSANLVVEDHCHEHNHHSHTHKHHHQPDHFHPGNSREFFSWLLVPLIMGTIVYRIVNYKRKEQYFKQKSTNKLSRTI